MNYLQKLIVTLLQLVKWKICSLFSEGEPTLCNVTELVSLCSVDIIWDNNGPFIEIVYRRWTWDKILSPYDIRSTELDDVESVALVNWTSDKMTAWGRSTVFVVVDATFLFSTCCSRRCAEDDA